MHWKRDGEIIRKIRALIKRGDYDEVLKEWNRVKERGLIPYAIAKAFDIALSDSSKVSTRLKPDEEKRFLTVVTINYNNIEGLKKTIDSVLSQTARKRIQYIVVDGASTDGSLEYLLRVSREIDLPMYGKDDGIYDAMNRGLRFADAEYTLFLNSGDCFVDNNVVEVIEKKVLSAELRPIAAYGDTLLSNGARWAVKPIADLWKGMICSHQSILIDTEFLKLKGFDKKKKIVSDYETIYKASLTDKPMMYLEMDVSSIEDVGVSADFHARTLERWQVVRVAENKRITRAQIDDYYLSLLNNETGRKMQIQAGSRPDNIKQKEVEERLIFLISMPRSGSTMLQKILESCPDIGTVGEPWVMLPLLAMYDEKLIEARYGQHLAILAGKEFIDAIGDKELFHTAQRAYADTIYQSALDSVGRTRFLDKTPRYVHIVDKLVELYPNAKYVVLLRNPAAIISSYAHTWAGGDYDVVAKNPEYMYDFTHGLPNLAKFVNGGRSNFYVVRYENLVANPEKEAKALFEYLQLPFSEELVNYGSKRQNKTPKYMFGDPNTVYSKSRPDATHAEKWISQNKSARSLHAFRRIVEDLDEKDIASLGYSKTKMLEAISEIEASRQIDLPRLVEKYSKSNSLPHEVAIPTFGKRLGVLITCHNNSATIVPALKSVLSQSKKPDIIVVADDASTDDSQSKVKAFLVEEGIDNVNLVCRRKNVGVAMNRDLAIRDMDADIISTLDGDDLYFPGKLEAEWRVLRGREDCLAFSDILICTENDSETLLDTSAYHGVGRGEVLAQLLTRSKPVPRDMMFSKKLYLLAGGFDHGVDIYEDWGFKQRLALATVDCGWLHSGAIGTVYDRRSPGLSGKPKVVHAFGELAMIGRNIDALKNYNEAVYGGLNSIIRHLSGQMRERAIAFMEAYPRDGVVPLYVYDSLHFLWQERKGKVTTDDMAKAIWHFFSPALKNTRSVSK